MDNRIRLPAGPIDFTNEVGTTGQDHDSYPASGQQARYDWMRLYLIGLLSNQSGNEAPTQFRVGTIWYDLAALSLKVRQSVVNGSVWADIAEAIALGDTNLKDWFELANAIILDNAPTMTFGGNSNNNSVILIPIPTSIQSNIIVGRTRPFVYINGILVNPKNTVIETTNVRLMNGDSLNDGDRYTVEFKNMSQFYELDVDV